MIKNERQYRITKSQAEKFQRSLADLAVPPNGDKIHPLLMKAQEDALRSQLADLQSSLQEYEALRNGHHTVIEAQTFDELPEALIKARIVLGLSQKELGDRLGLKEQQIQRYEATAYASASLERLSEIIQALGLRVREDIFLPRAEISLSALFKKLKEVGLDSDFVMSRLIPRSLTARLQRQATTQEEENSALQVASIIGRVFGWRPGAIFGAEPLQVDPTILGAARFKIPARVSERRWSVYTVYSHYLALLILQATWKLPQKPIPTDVEEVHSAVIESYGTLTFEHLLRYVWDLGIPVLPLKDPGAFHGACWRVDGRNVIVLKQSTRLEARWLFDLPHELRHAGQEPDKEQLAIIEPSEMSDEMRSDEERDASQFAGNLLLAGKAEELAEECVQLAKGSVERLKSVVPRVASEAGVPVGALANYMAFRLSLQGLNWWGAATNLQGDGADPWRIARDILLERVDFGSLSESDRSLLLQAVSESD